MCPTPKRITQPTSKHMRVYVRAPVLKARTWIRARVRKRACAPTCWLLREARHLPDGGGHEGSARPQPEPRIEPGAGRHVLRGRLGRCGGGVRVRRPGPPPLPGGPENTAPKHNVGFTNIYA